nr:transposase [Nitrosophilus labii]
MEEKFDFNKAVKELLAGKRISDKDEVLASLVKQLVEAALEAEIESHIADEVLKGKKNRRNGYNRKKIKSSDGKFELATPRDREGSFEPQIVKKHLLFAVM